MNKKNQDKSISWKNWIIKKLLSNDSTKEDILNFIALDDENNEVIKDIDDNNEKNLIKNILKLNQISVEDIMVPRSEIVAVEINQSYSEILEIIKKESHSRMPVFNENIDEVLGFFHIKDFLKTNENNFNLNKIIRESLFVAPKSPILDLLKTMRSSKIHIGLVVDGIGGVDGLVTIEDLVEEIVGDIEDEHDAEDDEDIILKKSDDTLIVDATYKISELDMHFELELQKSIDEEIDTVGGLVYSKINRIPKNNEIIEIENKIKIKILKSNDRKISVVEIKKIDN